MYLLCQERERSRCRGWHKHRRRLYACRACQMVSNVTNSILSRALWSSRDHLLASASQRVQGPYVARGFPKPASGHTRPAASCDTCSFRGTDAMQPVPSKIFIGRTSLPISSHRRKYVTSSLAISGGVIGVPCCGLLSSTPMPPKHNQHLGARRSRHHIYHWLLCPFLLPTPEQ